MITMQQRVWSLIHKKNIRFTNMQMELLCDADAEQVAARLKRVQAYVHDFTQTVKADKALRQVGSRLNRGILCKDRPNEDCLFVAQCVFHPCSAPASRLSLFVVADGMGGHEYGQEASQCAVQALVEYVFASLCADDTAPVAFSTVLQEGIQHANQALYQHNQHLGCTMGTTLTAVLVNDLTAYIAHAGDSRAYLYRTSSGLLQLTHDHSLVAALVEVGSIRPEEVYRHPGRNQIYRYLGRRRGLDVDTDVVSLVAGDTLLLCSDGLWEMVHDPQIEDILAHPTQDPTEVADTLVQAALAGGGEDNIGVIIVQV
jgi:serine/threonine protein phosphatase PrpC